MVGLFCEKQREGRRLEVPTMYRFRSRRRQIPERGPSYPIGRSRASPCGRARVSSDERARPREGEGAYDMKSSALVNFSAGDHDLPALTLGIFATLASIRSSCTRVSVDRATRDPSAPFNFPRTV